MNTKSLIPHFANPAEEAPFWDSHDFTDFVSETEPVEITFAKNLSTGITIRLEANDLQEMRSIAEDSGIGVSTLARMWIKRILKQERQNFT